MKKIIVVFVAIVLTILHANSQTIAGKYAGKNTADAFHLKPDSTFIYEYRSGHAYQYSTGTWQKIGKRTIVLNSDTSLLNPSVKIRETNASGNSRASVLDFTFTILGDPLLQDYKCQVIINDTVYDKISNGYLLSSGLPVSATAHEINIQNLWFRYIRCDSLSSLLVNTPIRSVSFKFVFSPVKFTSTVFANSILTTKKYFTEREAGRFSIETTLKDSMFYYTAFLNERLRVNKKGIALFMPKVNKWEKLPKVSDTENIFMRH